MIAPGSHQMSSIMTHPPHSLAISPMAGSRFIYESQVMVVKRM